MSFGSVFVCFRIPQNGLEHSNLQVGRMGWDGYLRLTVRLEHLTVLININFLKETPGGIFSFGQNVRSVANGQNYMVVKRDCDFLISFWQNQDLQK